MARTTDTAPWAFVEAVELWQDDADFEDVGPALRQARDDIDELTRRCVARARERGRSWVTIGEGLGVTRQAAQKRFDPPA